MQRRRYSNGFSSSIFGPPPLLGRKESRRRCTFAMSDGSPRLSLLATKCSFFPPSTIRRHLWLYYSF